MPIELNQRGSGHASIRVSGAASNTISLLDLQTVLIADTIDNAAAVDDGAGIVAIPVTGHAFVVGDNVTLDGTVNYDGNHTVVSANASHVFIEDAFQAETFAGTETINKYFEQVDEISISQVHWSVGNTATIARGSNNKLTLIGSGGWNLAAQGVPVVSDPTATVVITVDAGDGSIIVELKKTKVTLLNAGGPQGRSQY